MKVLWVSASPIGPAGRILNYEYRGVSGGWIQTVYEEIKESGKLQMAFLAFDKKIKLGDMKRAETEEGEAYCLHMPSVSFGRKAPDKLRAQVEEVVRLVKPDVIQIWGTETIVQNVVTDVCPDVKKVIFMQGLIGIHNRYYGGNLKALGFKFKMKPKEALVAKIKEKQFRKQIDFERSALRKAGNVIIDSVFAESYCKAVDHNIQVFHYRLNANEVFTKYSWSLDTCVPHTIFTVYGGGPDKGLHQLLRAVAIVKREIPDVKVIIPGGYHTTDGKMDPGKPLSAYERLLHNLTLELDIRDNVFFCGKLNPEGMAIEASKAHVYVNPSCMEVHAGSLREAMTVGTPGVTSVCGSVCEFVVEGRSGMLYRYEEHEVLARKIMMLMTDDDLARTIGENGRKAMAGYRLEKESQSILDIYERILRK